MRNSWKLWSLLWWPVNLEQNGLICQSLCLALTWLILHHLKYLFFLKECIGFIGAPNLGLFTLMDHSFKMIFLLAFLVEEGPSFFLFCFFYFYIQKCYNLKSSYSIALCSSSVNTKVVIIVVSQQGCCKGKKNQQCKQQSVCFFFCMPNGNILFLTNC